MLRPDYTSAFKRDIKTVQKRKWEISLLKDAITAICSETPLPKKFREHALAGDFAGCRECHIKPDWLLIWQVGNGIAVFVRTGSHSDLFG